MSKNTEMLSKNGLGSGGPGPPMYYIIYHSFELLAYNTILPAAGETKVSEAGPAAVVCRFNNLWRFNNL